MTHSPEPASPVPTSAMPAKPRALPAALVLICLASASILPLAATAATPPTPIDPSGAIAEDERAALARGFVSKWGGYAEHVYGVDVETWRERLAPSFARADAGNLREALRRDTFEGALAALGGVGHRVDDERIIDALAAAGPAPDIGLALGSLGEDLVYNPIQPCRIADTRVAGGVIGAGQTRNFRVAGVASFGDQGGNAGNCGLQAETPSAVVLNITAVTPSQAGFATVFPQGSPQPGTSSVNYVAGAIVNNTIISRTPNPAATPEVSVFSFAQSHFVLDIVGYFAPPRATALACVESGLASTTIAAGATGQVIAPSCPGGYAGIELDCESGSWLMPIVFSSLRGGGICGARNGGATSAVLSASRRCCRVPGR